MENRAAEIAWEDLRDLYLHATGPNEAEALAAALAASATSERLDDLIALLENDVLGDGRILFLQPIKRLGGTRGRQILESLESDAVFGQESQALLKDRRQN
jgi:hypothetical protein